MLVVEKVRQAKALLDEFNVDCWLTFVRESEINGDPTLDYLLGADVTWQSAFILSRKLGPIAIVGEYDRQMVDDIGAYDRIEGYVKSFREPLQKVMSEIDPTRIAVNYSTGSEVCDGLTHGMYLILTELLGEIGMADRLCSAEPLVSALRQRKTASELAAIREAIRHTEEIFALARDQLTPGRSERDVADFMQVEVERRGLDFAWPQRICPTVFTGPNTAEAHYPPSDRRIEAGHLVCMDFGVQVDGYCSDLQRTHYVLEPGQLDAPAEVKAAFTDLTDSIRRAVDVIRPGIQGVEADSACREYLVERGYQECASALGHQVGRYAHDGTALLGPRWQKYGEKPLQRLEEGMVFTVEPRVSVPGRGVATVEDMVLVTSEGAEYLSTPQKELILVGG